MYLNFLYGIIMAICLDKMYMEYLKIKLIKKYFKITFKDYLLLDKDKKHILIKNAKDRLYYEILLKNKLKPTLRDIIHSIKCEDSM